MYKIGLSSCGFDLNEENFKTLAKNGVSGIEISLKAEEYKDINYEQVKSLAEKYNVKLWSYHLPFYPFEEIDPSASDKAMRKHTVDYFSELIKKGSSIGIDKFVIHASGEPIDDAEKGERIKAAMESLDFLAEVGAKSGAVIAVEDLPRTCIGNSSEEILRVLSANDKLRVCFDTNHLLGESNLDFMDKVGDKIVTVHVSDYDFIDERHWLPGEGKLDWNAMYKKFKEIGYDGMWLYEIGLKAPDTIVRQRDLQISDFVKNAECIFGGETPTPLGRAKENLGMW